MGTYKSAAARNSHHLSLVHVGAGICGALLMNAEALVDIMHGFNSIFARDQHAEQGGIQRRWTTVWA
jgi:hypothetical protein